jgi:hypothetical protein
MSFSRTYTAVTISISNGCVPVHMHWFAYCIQLVTTCSKGTVFCIQCIKNSKAHWILSHFLDMRTGLMIMLHTHIFLHQCTPCKTFSIWCYMWLHLLTQITPSFLDGTRHCSGHCHSHSRCYDSVCVPCVLCVRTHILYYVCSMHACMYQ